MMAGGFLGHPKQRFRAANATEAASVDTGQATTTCAITVAGIAKNYTDITLPMMCCTSS